jgi:hypothetical protein
MITKNIRKHNTALTQIQLISYVSLGPNTNMKKISYNNGYIVQHEELEGNYAELKRLQYTKENRIMMICLALFCNNKLLVLLHYMVPISINRQSGILARYETSTNWA